MTQSFRPDRWQYVEKKAKKNQHTTEVPPEISEYLDKFVGRISLLTFTIFQSKPTDVLTRVRVFTYNKKIPMNVVQQCLVLALNCEVSPVNPYSITHSFDVVVPAPVTLADLAFRIVKALEAQL